MAGTILLIFVVQIIILMLKSPKLLIHSSTSKTFNKKESTAKLQQGNFYFFSLNVFIMKYSEVDEKANFKFL
jgi:hypothetical protein